MRDKRLKVIGVPACACARWRNARSSERALNASLVQWVSSLWSAECDSVVGYHATRVS